MTQERKLKTAIDLVLIQGRIKELLRSKAYFRSLSTYNERLRKLEDLEEDLLDILGEKPKREKEDVDKIIVKVHVPDDRDDRDYNRKRRYYEENDDRYDVIQFLKREKFILG
jgi:hypothetical protein